MTRRAFAVARDESEPAWRVDVQTVRMIAPSEMDAPDDAVRTRVDHGDLVACLHVDEDPPRDGVELDVACLTAELHGRDPSAAPVEHGLHATALVGDVHLPIDRVVCKAVGVDTCRCTPQHATRP